MTANALGVRGQGAFFHAALPMVGRFCGLDLVANPAGAVGAGGAFPMPQGVVYSTETIPGMPTEADFAAVEAAGSAFPFDLFGALRFWLTDQGHPATATDHWDRHDRLLAAASVQAQKGLLETPVVNGYLQLFRAWLGARTDLPVKTHRATVVLTHDVDDPVDPGDVGHALWVMGAATLKRRPRAALGHLRALPKTLWAKGRRHQHWNFADVVALEAEYGCRSAFYFASTPWWWPGAAKWDVTYDVRSPAFRAAFDHLRDAGAEVGLHLSYRARDDLDLLKAERARLERASGGPVIGGRHHYWHMHKPFWRTLRDHGRAGLRYDTSVGFNDAAGYRLGVALPFRPFDPQNDALIDVVQIPTLLMDGNLLYDADREVGEALEHIDVLLDRLKTYEGTAAIDWHVRTAWPGAPRFERWAAVYRGLLERLAQDSDIDVRLPVEVYDDYVARP